jgi:hypothetical protein
MDSTMLEDCLILLTSLVSSEKGSFLETTLLSNMGKKGYG